MGKFADVVKFADSDEPKLSDFNPYSIAWILQRYIEEMNGWGGKPPVRELGTSQLYTMRKLQRAPIGKRPARVFTDDDVIEHCKFRQAEGVLPQTTQQDLTYLCVSLDYAGAAWKDCKGISSAVIRAVKPFLKKHNYIAKSTPRDRRPTPEEIESLVQHFLKPAKRGRRKIPMAWLTRWQPASGRRIGETCKLLWADWDRDGQTILVRGMKDPKRRGKVKRVALPNEAQAMLVVLEQTRDPRQPRIFPYCAKSCSAAYTVAKREIGIDGLHLHDSRRECATRLVERDGYTSAQGIMVTGHETPAVFERTYLRQDPSLFKLGPKGRGASA